MYAANKRLVYLSPGKRIGYRRGPKITFLVGKGRKSFARPILTGFEPASKKSLSSQYRMVNNYWKAIDEKLDGCTPNKLGCLAFEGRFRNAVKTI
jgi:hypothetical protein